MAVWFRGETLDEKGQPLKQKPGTLLDHDFDDGMYLANRRHAGEGFATFRTRDVTRQRLWEVDIDVSSMRVLDLTKDKRWQEEMQRFPTLQAEMRKANVNYGRIFKNCLKAQKIDLKDYDAVMGPLYLGGSRGSLPEGICNFAS